MSKINTRIQVKSFFSSACLLFVMFTFSLVSTSHAQLLVDHQSLLKEGHFDLSPVLSFSSIEYDAGRGGNPEVERIILGLSAAMGLTEALNVYGELGFIADSEIEDSSSSGDGFVLGTGVRGLFLQEGKFSLIGRGGIRYTDEDYGSGLDGNFLEVDLGLLGRGQLNKEFAVYGGLDLFPFSDGEFDYDGESVDADRDTIIGLRLGADYLIDNNIKIAAEFALISEEAFLIRANFPF